MGKRGRKSVDKEAIAANSAALKKAENLKTKQVRIKHRNRRNLRLEFWSTEPAITQVKVWCMRGMRSEELAELMEITTRTLRNWCHQSPSLAAAIKLSKSIADAQVEYATFKNATGYYYEEDVMAGNGTVARLQKWQPANQSTQRWWLMNRQPASWRDTQHIEVEGTVHIAKEMAKLGTDDLRRIAVRGEEIDE